MTPQRGEVWIVDLGLAQKTRPALVISTRYSDDDRALITVISHTTKVRGSRFEAVLPVPFLKPGAFVGQSIVTIPAKLALRRVGALSVDHMKIVEDAVRRWLQL
jgi:mRNA interferase MazF